MTTEQKTRTLLVAILDESGSMGTKRTDVIGGFNTRWSATPRRRQALIAAGFDPRVKRVEIEEQ
jgi:hypothetical protein